MLIVQSQVWSLLIFQMLGIAAVSGVPGRNILPIDSLKTLKAEQILWPSWEMAHLIRCPHTLVREVAAVVY